MHNISRPLRLLDLFSGRWGWSQAFAAKGWECVGIDLIEPPSIPDGCRFIQADVLTLEWHGLSLYVGPQFCLHNYFDFIVTSSPCEQFSVHGMKHFHPNPPYPELGIKLFEHTRAICEASGVPYVMENVRAAQQFVGNAVHHCGPFYLWGTGVPPILHRGIIKGWETKDHKVNGRWVGGGPGRSHAHKSDGRKNETAKVATIPRELSHCVADYAQRIIEQVGEGV